MRWYVKVLRQYADFGGRARRTEYWMFALVNLGVVVLLAVADYGLGLQAGAGFGSDGLLGTIYTLAVLVPSLAVAARRLHDTDRSGWWQVLPVAPIGVIVLLALSSRIGAGLTGIGIGIGMGLVVMVLGAFALSILLIVWLATAGQRGPNRFGPDPKAVATA